MSLSLLGTATRYFLEVARTGSVTQAAEQLHVAVSAVSRQIAKLEDSLGCSLFERQARGMALNAAGERLAAYVRTTMLDAERVVDEVKGLGGQRARRIRIACTEGLACGFMAEVMASFRAAHPGCSIHLQVGTPDEVSRHLLRGEVDLVAKFSVAPEKGLKIEHQQPAPIMVLAAPGHALARRRSVSMADIVRHPLAVPEAGTTVRQMLDLCCSLKGLHYQVAYTGNYPTLLALTAQGEVLTFSALVSAAHAIRAGELVAVSVNEPQFRQRSLQVLTLQGQAPSRLASDFRDHLIATALRLGQAV
ncbi:LysR family transcriptional regulator [Polaromonas sp. P2-4]|nr:LysR family transcriptional regulator [Polaromonas sp. P2-4]